MKEYRKQRNSCAYCGASHSLTVDHIPPRTLFPKPRPSNLITVPCCKSCNEGASKDDEYFRLVLSMRYDTGDHPAVRGILPSVYRSLENPNKRGLQVALAKSFCRIPVLSPERRIRGLAAGYDVDLRRLGRVAERITRGLFFHELGYRVPDDFCVRVYSPEGLRGSESCVDDGFICFVERLTRTPSTVLSRGVFAYWFQRIQERTHWSAWVLTFYERVPFLGLVVPRNAVAL